MPKRSRTNRRPKRANHGKRPINHMRRRRLRKKMKN